MSVSAPEEDAAWARRRHYEFGRRFLFEWNDGQRLISAGRSVMLALAGALLALVAACGLSRWGLAVGATCPLSRRPPPGPARPRPARHDRRPRRALHVRLAAPLREIARPAQRSGALFGGLLLGCAFATKFSSLILVPLLAALAPPRASPLRSRSGPAAAANGGAVAVSLLVSPLVVWACYGFHAHVTPDAAVNQAFTLDHERPANALLWNGALVAQRLRLLPDAYLYGLLRFARHSESRRAFLLGEYVRRGWWYYFPVTLALKTPLPLLPAGAARPWRADWRAPRARAALAVAAARCLLGAGDDAAA